jgi:hypothetical protein
LSPVLKRELAAALRLHESATQAGGDSVRAALAEMDRALALDRRDPGDDAAQS